MPNFHRTALCIFYMNLLKKEKKKDKCHNYDFARDDILNNEI